MPSSRPDSRPDARPTRRRTPGAGPRGATRPGTRPSAERSSTERRGAAPRTETDPGAGRPTPVGRQVAADGPHRARPTGRLAVLVLVVAVLTLSYASSMRAYLVQREEIQGYKADIAQREEAIADLEREKQRWEDPAFVAAQARERFGYVMVGETAFQVLGADNEPLEAAATLHDPAQVIKEKPTAWWETAWGSMELAGSPPPPAKEKPAELIDGTKQ